MNQEKLQYVLRNVVTIYTRKGTKITNKGQSFDFDVAPDMNMFIGKNWDKWVAYVESVEIPLSPVVKEIVQTEQSLAKVVKNKRGKK